MHLLIVLKFSKRDSFEDLSLVSRWNLHLDETLIQMSLITDREKLIFSLETRSIHKNAFYLIMTEVFFYDWKNVYEFFNCHLLLIECARRRFLFMVFKPSLHLWKRDKNLSTFYSQWWSVHLFYSSKLHKYSLLPLIIVFFSFSESIIKIKAHRVLSEKML